MPARPMLNLVVALEAEARPLVEHLGLRAVAGGPWRRWRGDGVALVVSGVGKLAAAAATACLAAATGEATDGSAATTTSSAGAPQPPPAHGEAPARHPAAWLNLGLGGHARVEIGAGLLAHKVTDAGSGLSWYPPLVFPPPGATASLLTVDRPESAYPGEEVYEMEAAGFFAAAGRLAPLELVHAYKVISDNRERPASRRPTKTEVAELMAGRLPEIDRLLAALAELAALAGELDRLAAEPPELERFLAHCPFTVTQQRRLRSLLARWAAVAGEAAWSDDLARHRRAGDLLAELEGRINARAPHLTPSPTP